MSIRKTLEQLDAAHEKITEARTHLTNADTTINSALGLLHAAAADSRQDAIQHAAAQLHTSSHQTRHAIHHVNNAYTSSLHYQQKIAGTTSTTSDGGSTRDTKVHADGRGAALGHPSTVRRELARGGPIPTDGPAAQCFEGTYRRYGDLSDREFFDKYWKPDGGSDGMGGWDYPTEEDGFPDGFAELPQPNTLEIGDVIDRFGDPDGEYASPLGTLFARRSLPPSSIRKRYVQYRVKKKLPPSVTQGKVAPAFEQCGGGIQYKFDKPISWYAHPDQGYLEKV